MSVKEAIVDRTSRIIYDKHDKVVVITINRPEKLNAMDPQANDELAQAFEQFKYDPDAWVAIITGAGDRAFCAGYDLEAAREMRFGKEDIHVGGRLLIGVTKGLELWKPSIAAINGLAMGQGLEMALACDLRIAADVATFGLPEVRWGVIAAGGGLSRVPRAMPIAKAMEIILIGDPITAQEALHYGLVNKVVPQSEVIPTAMKWAERICENGPLAVRASKECVLRGLGMGLEDAMRLEEHLLVRLLQTEDVKEGPKAFVEKRKPQFRAR